MSETVRKRRKRIFLCSVMALFFAFSYLSINSSLLQGSFSESSSSSALFLSPQNSSSASFAEISFAEGNSIITSSAPYFTKGQVLGSQIEKRDSIVSYKVERGDTLGSISREFQISVDTIKWANSASEGSLNIGDELLILPTTGVLYYVQRGDTLSTIAERHSANREDITSFNNIEDSSQIRPGDQLIIPEGKKPKNIIPQSPSTHRSGFVSVTHGTVTQVTHSGHRNAVDIANACGTPLYAATSGVVIDRGYDPQLAGNYIWIDHGSITALYAHMRDIHVSSGQRVSAGQQVGTMGNTGYTIGATGCHIHFQTREPNPFSYLQRGQTMR